MIVLLRHGADAGDVREFVDAVRALGLDVVPLDDRKGRGFEILGIDRGKVLALRDSPAVAEILTRRTALTGGEPLWPHFLLRLTVLGLAVLSAVLLVAAWLPPRLADAQATILCRRIDHHQFGTHSIFIGVVEAVTTREGVNPLVYLDGRYGSVGD